MNHKYAATHLPTSTTAQKKELHIAPMLDVSTPEFHHLVRILTKKAVLWTEMVVDETVVFTDDLDQHMAISSPSLHPIICQIGGRSSEYCAKATMAVRRYGYKEVNLNVDCPSSRVSGKRQFGAILMSTEHQSTCYDVVSAMKRSSEGDLNNDDYDQSVDGNEKSTSSTNTIPIPISVKTRVGIETIDGKCYDDMEYISNFLENLRERGCKRFVIHARKCVIGGLTPAENRLVPPLNYPRFYSLCHRFPDCEFVLNGGIPGLEAARSLCYGEDSNNHTDNHVHYEDRDHQTENPALESHCPKNSCENETDQHQHQHQHIVPCKICNVKNGSCTAPPKTKKDVPKNLTGCMIGRACMENPIMFWDVDRYFYGMEENPCQSRREVLEQYCKYLERTYPRRCCDYDDRVTSRIPAPSIDLSHSGGGCHICCEFYGRTINTSMIKNNDCTNIHCEQKLNENDNLQLEGKKEIKLKISSRVIDRSLKPILGIFFGRHKSKFFRRECDRLSRDKSVRNCGPGYILRKALSVMPDKLIDEKFIKTEDLEDVPKHYSPKT